jgi:hypothetical protein
LVSTPGLSVRGDQSTVLMIGRKDREAHAEANRRLSAVAGRRYIEHGNPIVKAMAKMDAPHGSSN